MPFVGGRPVRRDPRFQFLGCFRDKGRRALPRRILLLRGVYRGFWLVNRCGRIALRKGYRVFSVQSHNECWSGRNAHKTYGRYGRRGGCRYWTGAPWGNDVYRIKGGAYFFVEDGVSSNLAVFRKCHTFFFCRYVGNFNTLVQDMLDPSFWISQKVWSMESKAEGVYFCLNLLSVFFN